MNRMMWLLLLLCGCAGDDTTKGTDTDSDVPSDTDADSDADSDSDSDTDTDSDSDSDTDTDTGCDTSSALPFACDDLSCQPGEYCELVYSGPPPDTGSGIIAQCLPATACPCLVSCDCVTCGSGTNPAATCTSVPGGGATCELPYP